MPGIVSGISSKPPDIDSSAVVSVQQIRRSGSFEA
jgi:hypothetical protein